MSKTSGASPFTYQITGLSATTSYDVRVTYTDPDGATGTNPQCTTVTTLGGVSSGLVSSVVTSAAFASRAPQTGSVTGTFTSSAKQAQFTIGTSPAQTSSCLTVPTGGGTLSFDWDGKDGNSSFVVDGIYSVTISAFGSNNCTANANQKQGDPITVSNAAAMTLSPPSGAVTLYPGESVVITAAASNYQNGLVPDGGGATVSWTATGSANQTSFSLRACTTFI
jgi:flagellar hook assembly protein FlgD